MKTKKLEKLHTFQLKSEKLSIILGGKGAPVSSFEGSVTGGGTHEFPEAGGCVCYSYTSDLDLPGGGRGYYGVQRTDLPC